ncbi:hypothetical protein [Granulicoccus phenolivorans]|uniref:hypothetical protein n=1 Tax=Granulicoccus phenolivorans TaxID=266854 RepID=UPI00040FDE96|nr:hypothetical protein [Granulicoccus phenolivorans]
MRASRLAITAALGVALTAAGAGTALAATPTPTPAADSKASTKTVTPHATTPGAAAPSAQRDAVVWTKFDITPSSVRPGDKYTIQGEAKSVTLATLDGKEGILKAKASNFSVTFETSPAGGTATCSATSTNGTVNGGKITFSDKETGSFTINCTYNKQGRFKSDVKLSADSAGFAFVGEQGGYTIGIDPTTSPTATKSATTKPTATKSSSKPTATKSTSKATDQKGADKKATSGGKLAKTGA